MIAWAVAHSTIGQGSSLHPRKIGDGKRGNILLMFSGSPKAAAHSINQPWCFPTDLGGMQAPGHTYFKSMASDQGKKRKMQPVFRLDKKGAHRLIKYLKAGGFEAEAHELTKRAQYIFRAPWTLAGWAVKEVPHGLAFWSKAPDFWGEYHVKVTVRVPGILAGYHTLQVIYTSRGFGKRTDASDHAYAVAQAPWDYIVDLPDNMIQ